MNTDRLRFKQELQWLESTMSYLQRLIDKYTGCADLNELGMIEAEMVLSIVDMKMIWDVLQNRSVIFNKKRYEMSIEKLIEDVNRVRQK